MQYSHIESTVLSIVYLTNVGSRTTYWFLICLKQNNYMLILLFIQTYSDNSGKSSQYLLMSWKRLSSFLGLYTLTLMTKIQQLYTSEMNFILPINFILPRNWRSRVTG